VSSNSRRPYIHGTSVLISMARFVSSANACMPTPLMNGIRSLVSVLPGWDVFPHGVVASSFADPVRVRLSPVP
jgi:hypothetical protein